MCSCLGGGAGFAEFFNNSVFRISIVQYFNIGVFHYLVLGI